MALSKTASITFTENEQEATSYYPYAANLAGIATFAATIQQYSVATIAAYSYTEEQTEPNLTPPAGVEALNFQAIIKMRKPSQIGTQQITLPAPDPAIFDFIEGRGYQVKKAIGDAIATAYSTLMGQTYIFESGWLTS